MRSCNRREFLRTIAQAGIYYSAPSLAGATDFADTVTVSIIHTTDLHGRILPTTDYNGNTDVGGLARCATQIRRWRRQNRNSILIDAGDVYQGTDVSLRSNGELMIELFNHLKYDAWIVGNHEFDWGREIFSKAVARSAMPVLGANISVEGTAAGESSDAKHPIEKIQPYILKELDGIKIAIVGVTTPGMTFWLPPEFTRGLDFQHPVEPVRRAIARAKSEGANAVVVAGHMGLKPRSGGDDFANSAMALTSEFPDLAAFIAGHTHQLVTSRLTNGVLLTQADHFGIHAGRVDLVFDRNSKRLLYRRSICERMDHRVRFSHVVLSRANVLLNESQTALAEPIGELIETLHAREHPGRPSDVERLIGAAVIEALQDNGVTVDGVMHGPFDEKNDLAAGSKTVQDVWKLIPFENYLVTAELNPEELKAIMEEVYASHEPRNLLGFEIETEPGDDRKIKSLRLTGIRELDRNRRYLIAFNSFDSRSGGHRFMKLRALLDSPVVNRQLHPIQTRDAVIEYFQRHKVVGKIVIATALPVAA